MEPVPDRRSEWFVPQFGPVSFRLWVGLLFLPYTGMVLAFAVIGSMLAERIFWERVGAIVVIYFLGLGVAAHALDALGGKGIKPWGRRFTKRQLWIVAIGALTPAYTLGFYYIFFKTPQLAVIALLEGFFLFAYNLELLDGRFHTDAWFAFSWGSLPVLAGYVIQTNRVSFPALILAAAMGLLSLVEINASRPYKELKRSGRADPFLHQDRYEAILKCISLGVMLIAAGLAAWRWVG
ncbi:MAG: UbiA prenyltransferase family protein [Nitrospirae bacterium]|nr:UbiA prenyltransferase family protein [Candidatus Manganitrophaceae bacterium]